MRRKRQARRAAILEAATRLVGERGIEGLTLQGIAGSLDYTVGALYRYFPSKDALVAELQASVIAVLDAKIHAVWERCASWSEQDGATDPRLATLLPLVATAALYERVARMAPEQFGVLSRSLGDPQQLIEESEARRVFAAARPLFAALAERFEEAARSGALGPGDPLQRALGFWASLHGVVQLRKLTRIDPVLLETRVLLDTVTLALFAGFGADPALLERARGVLQSAHLAEVPVRASDFSVRFGPEGTPSPKPAQGPGRRGRSTDTIHGNRDTARTREGRG